MSNQYPSGPVIYIVDDDADVARIAEPSSVRWLTERNLRFNGSLLKSKLADDVSCLILDVRLPGLSGLDFRLKLSRNKSKSPSFLSPDMPTSPCQSKAMKLGCGIPDKAHTRTRFLDAVQMALDRDRARRQHDSDMQELRANYDSLSHREREVLRLVVAGLMNKQAAAEIE